MRIRVTYDSYCCVETVTDVADALVMRRLFEALIHGGMVLVATSNSHPTNLYKVAACFRSKEHPKAKQSTPFQQCTLLRGQGPWLKAPPFFAPISSVKHAPNY